MLLKDLIFIKNRILFVFRLNKKSFLMSYTFVVISEMSIDLKFEQ